MLNRLIAAWFTPAPDSGVADDIRRGKSPWADSVHLLWMMWVFITPLFEHGLAGYTRTWLLLTLVSLPAFLLLYAKMNLAPRRMVYFYPLGMAALGLGLLRWYPSGVSYFIFACVMLRFCSGNIRFRRYMVQLALMNAVYVALAWWVGYPPAMLVVIPAMVLLISIIVMVEHKSKEKDAALRLSQDEVRRLAATAERERIGRDLHDLLGHTLSLITLKLELSRKLFDRDVEAARREVVDAEEVARKALAEVRSAVTGIRATDIAVELAAAKLMLESAAVHLEYNAPPPLPAEVAHALALILREAVTNISRHAGASTARIHFEKMPAGIQLSIADNGRGGVLTDGNGLSGIRERVISIGGALSLGSATGQGTTLLIKVPLAAYQRIDSLNKATASPLLTSRPGADAGAETHAPNLAEPSLAGDRR